MNINLTIETLSKVAEALEDANRNIQEANYQLADGPSYAWLSYTDMGYFLENLYEVSEVDDPGTTCYGL